MKTAFKKSILVSLVALCTTQVMAITPSGSTSTSPAKAVTQQQANKTTYHNSGEIKKIIEYENGKKLKSTNYYKTGEPEHMIEYVNGRRSMATSYYTNGQVTGKYKYVNRNWMRIKP